MAINGARYYYGGKDINGGGCMKDEDGRLVVSEKDRGKLWKDHMEKIMNVENLMGSNGKSKCG